MFKLFVFACLLAVAAAAVVGYGAPNVVSAYSAPLTYAAAPYAATPLTYSAYSAPLALPYSSSYNSGIVKPLAYTAYSAYNGYPYVY